MNVKWWSNQNTIWSKSQNKGENFVHFLSHPWAVNTHRNATIHTIRNKLDVEQSVPLLQKWNASCTAHLPVCSVSWTGRWNCQLIVARAKTCVKCNIEMSVIIQNMTHRRRRGAEDKCAWLSKLKRARIRQSEMKQTLEKTDSHPRSGVLNLSCFYPCNFSFRFIYHLFMFSLEIIRHNLVSSFRCCCVAFCSFVCVCCNRVVFHNHI